jgi:hypothetical protein
MHFETAMDQSISSRVVVQVIRGSTNVQAQLGPKRQCDKAKDAPQLKQTRDACAGKSTSRERSLEAVITEFDFRISILQTSRTIPAALH